MADEDSRVLELLKVLGGLGSGAALVSTLLTPPRLVLEGQRATTRPLRTARIPTRKRLRVKPLDSRSTRGHFTSEENDISFAD